MKKILLISLLFILPLQTDEKKASVQKTDSTLSAIPFISIPPRPKGAMKGSQFAKTTENMTGRQRQRLAVREIRRGNIPPFMRKLHPVIITEISSGADTTTAVIWVTPDYLAIGSDDDFLRMPLSYPSATAVASSFECILPTRKMVDAVYQQSAFHFTPQPLPPGPKMRSCVYYLEHQRKIEEQRGKRHLGELVSGHKKDLVLTNRLWMKQDRVAIYGWHNSSDCPIQELSTVHGARYADYSHGVRLVSQNVLINGIQYSIHDVLADSLLATVLTYEGVIVNSRGLLKRTAK